MDLGKYPPFQFCHSLLNSTAICNVLAGRWVLNSCLYKCPTFFMLLSQRITIKPMGSLYRSIVYGVLNCKKTHLIWRHRFTSVVGRVCFRWADRFICIAAVFLKKSWLWSSAWSSCCVTCSRFWKPMKSTGNTSCASSPLCWFTTPVLSPASEVNTGFTDTSFTGIKCLNVSVFCNDNTFDSDKNHYLTIKKWI